MKISWLNRVSILLGEDSFPDFACFFFSIESGALDLPFWARAEAVLESPFDRLQLMHAG
jgi:hypothetical protein